MVENQYICNTEDHGWKGKLGWSFSKEDCEYEKRICREVEKWWEKHFPSPKKGPAFKFRYTSERFEMTVEEAMALTGLSKRSLNYGINKGLLPVHRKIGLRNLFLYSDHLRDYKRLLDADNLPYKYLQKKRK